MSPKKFIRARLKKQQDVLRFFPVLSAAKFVGTVIVLAVVLIVASRTIHRLYEGAW